MKIKNKKAILGGVGIGFVNGLFGGGGGMIAVPVLTGALNYDRKEAHATAIFIIFPICAVSALTYIINGFCDLSVIIPATIGNIAGGFLGAVFLGKLPKFWVQTVFIIIMAVAGVRMVIG